MLAHPVHDGEQIYVISQSGLLSAYEAQTGFQVWEHAVAGVQMPWLAGESLFVLAVEGHVISLRKSDGAVRWITALDGSGTLGVSKPGTVTDYVGPVVASGVVYVLSGERQIGWPECRYWGDHFQPVSGRHHRYCPADCKIQPDLSDTIWSANRDALADECYPCHSRAAKCRQIDPV